MSAHLQFCEKATGEYYIYTKGNIIFHYTDLHFKSIQELINIYNIPASTLAYIRLQFKYKGYTVEYKKKPITVYKNKCPYCYSTYKSLQGLATHLGVCESSTGEYVISRKVGLIHYTELDNKKRSEIIEKYPELTTSTITSFRTTFKKRGITVAIIPEKVYTYYKCPYCSSYKKKNGSLFKNWLGVAEHVHKCAKSTDEYYFNSFYGPISKHLLNSHSSPYIKALFPKLGLSPKHIRTERLEEEYSSWFREELIQKAQEFFETYKRVPTTRDFNNTDMYPSASSVYKEFGSWKSFIEFAGLEYVDNSFGVKTISLDGNTYRSINEALFVDKFLYKKFDYIIEPSYPGMKWLYDWYIKDLGVYIELAGGLNPERIQEKIEYNKQLKRKLLVVYPDYIYRFNNLKEIIDEKI